MVNISFLDPDLCLNRPGAGWPHPKESLRRDFFSRAGGGGVIPGPAKRSMDLTEKKKRVLIGLKLMYVS